MGLKLQTQAALICEKYRKLAPRFVHSNALKHTFPKCFRRSTLVIGVENSAWAHQVLISKQGLIEEINRQLGKTQLKNIQTKIELLASSPQNFL